MLSIIDIKKELGKNIYIYPVYIGSIKSNSIDLHVSRFAWSLSSKKSIVQDEYVCIPPNDTGLVYTEESIYVTNKIGGTYHSKVTLVSQGLGHIGTSLDAQYIGNSLIAIHNLSQSVIKLKIGSEFVTVQFNYLNTPDYPDAPSHDNSPGHPRLLSGFQDVRPYIEWRDKNTWVTRKKDLYLKMIESENFNRCNTEFKKELDQFNRKKVKSRIKRYLCVGTILLGLCLLFSIPSYFYDFGTFTSFIKNIAEKVVFPIAVSGFTTFIIVDLKNST